MISKISIIKWKNLWFFPNFPDILVQAVFITLSHISPYKLHIYDPVLVTAVKQGQVTILPSNFCVQDPDKNRIAQWVDVKPFHGILDLHFPLASEAPLGTYIIKIGQEEFGTEKQFRVEEYGKIKRGGNLRKSQLSKPSLPIKYSQCWM